MELRPCPFCGGKARLRQRSRDNEDGVSVECCGCEAEVFFYKGKGAQEAAIKTWNTRHNDVDNTVSIPYTPSQGFDWTELPVRICACGHTKAQHNDTGGITDGSYTVGACGECVCSKFKDKEDLNDAKG